MNNRLQALEHAAAGIFDVCVIGGGASGSGCALDSQLRGMDTVLVDASDFASATSSASTKLAHGGVRYLSQAVTRLDIGQFMVLKSALRERSLMIRNAPFLARPLELLIPCRDWRELLYYGCGMKLYDLLSGKARLGPSRFLSREESVRRVPMLTAERGKLVGAVTYADGQFDDARYNLTLIRTFTDAGGEALNYARAIGFETDTQGKLTSARVEDTLSGRRFSIRARAFVNATGPFADSVRELVNPRLSQRLRLSKGIHILFPLELFEGSTALLIPKTEDGRVLFAIPWLGQLLVGTTETEASLEHELVVQELEARYVLRQLNPYLRSPLLLEQIVSGFAGLRPLLKSGSAQETNRLTRDHEVEVDSASGLVSILGGKWTTYRAMAEDTINTVQRYLYMSVTKCPTALHALSGSENYTADFWRRLLAEYELSESTARHLAGKYGSLALDVLSGAAREPELLNPIVGGMAPIRAEIVFSIRHEMAISIEDILARRIGLQLSGWRQAVRAAPIVAHYLARELSWSPSQSHDAIRQYVAKINRMLKSIGLEAEPVIDSK